MSSFYVEKIGCRDGGMSTSESNFPQICVKRATQKVWVQVPKLRQTKKGHDCRLQYCNSVGSFASMLQKLPLFLSSPTPSQAFSCAGQAADRHTSCACGSTTYPLPEPIAGPASCLYTEKNCPCPSSCPGTAEPYEPMNSNRNAAYLPQFHLLWNLANPAMNLPPRSWDVNASHGASRVLEAL